MHQFVQFFIDLWYQIPGWGQYLLTVVGELIAIAVPLILSVAYLTYFERKVVNLPTMVFPSLHSPRHTRS